MPQLNWIHFSDLLLSSHGSRLLQPECRDALEKDLRKMHEQTGPWDLVLISGNLTKSGSAKEFELLTSTLNSLWKVFNSLGSDPCLLAVPGECDFRQARSNSEQGGFGPFGLPAADMRNVARNGGQDALKHKLRVGLTPFMDWFFGWQSARPVPSIQQFRHGLLPGDFAVTVNKEGRKVGIVGLNSLFLSSPSERPSVHEVDLQQLEAAPSLGVRKWAQEHDVVLLLTQHAPNELRTQPLTQLLEAVTPPSGFTVHLCGNADESLLAKVTRAYAVFQTSSLFGTPAPDRNPWPYWGYAVGSIGLGSASNKIGLHLFPRVAEYTKVHGMVLGPDLRFPLDDDDAFSARPLEIPPGESLDFILPKPVSVEVHLKSPPQEGLFVLEATAPNQPPGLQLRAALGTGNEMIGRVCWAPSGDLLGLGLLDGRVASWALGANKPSWVEQAHGTGIVDLAYSSDGRMLVSRSRFRLRFWNVDDSYSRSLMPIEMNGVAVAWSPSGFIAFDNELGHVFIWKQSTEDWKEVLKIPSISPDVTSLAWSPDGQTLAAGSTNGELTLIKLDAPSSSAIVLENSKEGRGAILNIAWSSDSRWIAMACQSKSIQIWDSKKEASIAILEGHTDAVVGVSFSGDGRLLASKSLDGTVRLFRTDTWVEVAKLEEPASPHTSAGLAFSPKQAVLATLVPGGHGVRLWDIDVEALLRTEPSSSKTVHTTSAKVVLVGEGRAGKSCLALRMVNDRYEELGSTHGMRFWSMPVEVSDEERNAQREVILWDLGGQSEYQLVHQLFLRDSTIALMVMEPGRGKPALDELEGWNQRLLAQTGVRTVQKLLVGAKVDDTHSPVDHGAIDHFVQRLRFSGYVSTSARTGRGIAELKATLARIIEWGTIERVSRPELFQRLREHIQRLREARKVVITYTDLEDELRRETGSGVHSEALQAVVAQLARQGLLADTRMADGTRALVLEVEQVERYAGSLILAARDNPHGVPVLDMGKVRSPSMQFPRIRPEERLPWGQELIVLDCVIQLLLEHGLCFHHEGRLIFPSLFQPTQHGPTGDFPYSISMHYDFSGPVDNIYASLVSSLAISKGFGPMRLWENRAEFGRAQASTAGVRRVQHGSQGARGFARLDVFFDTETPKDKRDEFVSLVEEHLAEHGVELLERLSVTCTCGEVFTEDVVLKRIEAGAADIGCQVCDHRTPLTLGAQAARAQAPALAKELAKKTQVLRTKVREQRSQDITVTKILMAEAEKLASTQDTPLRILHLSDLHVGAKDDPNSLLQPLVADLSDEEEGLGLERLDYLVISGDITNRATPEEFEKAHEFVSRLIQKFGLTPERCIIVPGNHDLHWDTEVYSPKKRRQVNEKDLRPGMFHQEGDMYLMRDEARYPERFRNFSQHFYHPLLQKEYPLPVEQQCLSFFFPESRIQFLTMNSAWEIDEYFPERSGISEAALSRGLAEAEQQVAEARKAGTFAADSPVLRLGVWHHPVTGNEKIQADAFMDRLLQANVRVCLHGHVHEERMDRVHQYHSSRRLHVLGAGSFGAPMRERPESVPRLYNLLEVNRNLEGLRVHTRCLNKQGGAWQGWAAWKGPEKNTKLTYFDVPLT